MLCHLPGRFSRSGATATIIAFEGGSWLLGSKNVVGCCAIMGKRKVDNTVAAGGSLDTANLLLRTKLPHRTLGTLFLALSLILLPGLFGCSGDPVDVVEPEVTPTATPVPSPTHTSVPDPLPSPSPTDAPTSNPASTLSATPTVPATSATSGEVRSDKDRITDLAVPDSDVATLVGGNSAFAFDLYHALTEKDGNLFYSPYSISVALAMTYAGARGETERQMADTLHYRLSQDKLHNALNGLDLDLASRGKNSGFEDSERIRLNIANAIWGQAGYQFAPDFLDVLALNYGAGMRSVNFVEAPEESRKAINDWVAESTEDRIRDLIPKKGITEQTRLVLANAIYFNASWLWTFDEELTDDHPFHLLNGDSVNTPMMTQTADFGYVKKEGYLALELPYRAGNMSMLVLLPDEGMFNEFETALDTDLVRQALEEMEYTYLRLKMPKFKVESQFKLNEVLEDMGMPNAFSGSAADFSGMDGHKCGDDPGCLVISKVFHKAFVSVDEEGTEAAAATAVAMAMSSRPEPQPVVIDRPFIFLIRDTVTDSILFVGRVVDPSV